LADEGALEYFLNKKTYKTMKNFSKLFILGFFCFVVTSCEKDNLKEVESLSLSEDASEIEILESTYKKTAFKETIEITSGDGLLKYIIQVGSFDEERFREGMKVRFKLLKNQSITTTGVNSGKLPLENNTNDLQRLIFEIRNISNRVLSNSYTLSLDFTELNLEANSSKNAKVNNYWNYELISDLRPKRLNAGRPPVSEGATGSVYFWLGGKTCGVCSYNNFYINTLPIPSTWSFNVDHYRRGRVRADLSPDVNLWYFTFTY
jgi:hypothetical protein